MAAEQCAERATKEGRAVRSRKSPLRSNDSAMNTFFQFFGTVAWVRRTALIVWTLDKRVRGYLSRRSPAVLEARANRSRFYHTAWHEAAAALGAQVTDLGRDILEISKGPNMIRVRQNYTPLDHCVSLAVAGDKMLTNRLLARCGVPVPPSAEFSLDDLSPAEAFLNDTEEPCVVKPAVDAAGGSGVTTGIRTHWQLARAAASASVFGTRLMIQPHIDGDNYRLLYLDGELLDAVVLRSPSVTGDGRHRVKTLVQRTNADRLRADAVAGQRLLSFDFEMQRTLARQGLTLGSIVPAGQQVTLKSAVNENSGADTHSAKHLLCDSVVRTGMKAAASVGARMAGVDIITRDPGAPLAAQGGVVIEVNTTPGFYWHYAKHDGACPVAQHVLQRLLSTRNHGDADMLFDIEPAERIPCR